MLTARAGFLVIIALADVGFIHGAGSSPPAPSRQGRDDERVPDPEWHPLASGSLVQVLAAPTLYRARETVGCLVRVKVSNTSSKRIGVDLRDYWNVIYPNQWTVSPEPRRLVVDETELSPRPLNNQERRLLRERYRREALTFIQPHGAGEYLREFNGTCPTSPDLRRGRYVIMSMSGRLWVTDGEQVEEVTLLGLPPERRDVVMALPLAWADLPGGIRVIRHP